MPDISIGRMLKDFGITAPGAQEAARDALAAAGIISSRPNRTNIAAQKSDGARRALLAAFTWHCGNGDCRREADAAPRLLVEKSSCMICGGSNDRRALEKMASTMVAAGMSRVLVVGGTDAKCREILKKSPCEVQWRFVDGKKSRDDRYFRHNREWAEVIIIWGSTVLDHRVSAHFDRKGDHRVITVTRRSIGALAHEVVDHLNRRYTELARGASTRPRPPVSFS